MSVLNHIKKIGFSPCWIPEDQEKTFKYINQFYNQISNLHNNFDYEVIILCLNENPSNGDVLLCKQVEQKLLSSGIKCKLIYYSLLGVIGTWYEINNLDYYFTVRLHGAITAYLTETPFFLYEYHEKCSEFLKFISKNCKYNEIDFINHGLKSPLLPVNEYYNYSKLNFLECPLYKG